MLDSENHALGDALVVLEHQLRIVLILVQLRARREKCFLGGIVGEVQPRALEAAVVVLAVGADVHPWLVLLCLGCAGHGEPSGATLAAA